MASKADNPGAPTIPDSENEMDPETDSLQVEPVGEEEARTVEINLSDLPEDYNDYDSYEEEEEEEEMDCTDPSVTWNLEGDDEQEGSRPLLHNSLGFSYMRTVNRRGDITWRCSFRDARVKCPANVMQHEDRFVASQSNHCHEPHIGAAAAGAPARKPKRSKEEKESFKAQHAAQLDALDDDLLRQEEEEQENKEDVAERKHIVNKSKEMVKDEDWKNSSTQKKGSKRKGSSMSSTKVKKERTSAEQSNLDDSSLNTADNEASRLYTDLDWEIMENGTNRGNPELCNSMGYTYTMSRVRNLTTDPNAKLKTVYWRCTVRRRDEVCRSRVIQTGEADFKCLGPLHSHPPKKNAAYRSKIRALIREVATDDPTQTSEDIVTKALEQSITRGLADPSEQHPPKHLLLKEATRMRYKLNGIVPKPQLSSKGVFESAANDAAHMEWQILPNASNRGNDCLINKYGYTYTKQKEHNGVTDWRCSVRTKNMTCKARAIQKGDLFAPSEATHCHLPRDDAHLKFKVKESLRTHLNDDILLDGSTPTSRLIEAALEHDGIDKEYIEKKNNIIRIVNKKRKSLKDQLIMSLPREEHSYTTTTYYNSEDTKSNIIKIHQDTPTLHADENSMNSEENSGIETTTTMVLTDTTTPKGGATYMQVVQQDPLTVVDMGTGESLIEEVEEGEVDMGEMYTEESEDGTVYLIQKQPAASEHTETEQLTSRVEELEAELKRCKAQIAAAEKASNRPMLVRMANGSVQRVNCSHQAELSMLRNFRDAAQTNRSKLIQENENLRHKLDEMASKYEQLSQQMALREAEWCEREANGAGGGDTTVFKQEEEVSFAAQNIIQGEDGQQYTMIEVPADGFYQEGGEGTVMYQQSAQRLTQPGDSASFQIGNVLHATEVMDPEEQRTIVHQIPMNAGGGEFVVAQQDIEECEVYTTNTALPSQ